MATENSKAISSLMTETRTFPPPERIQSNAYINSPQQYEEMYRRSVEDSEAFWLEQAKTLTWFKEPTQGRQFTWDTAARKIEHTWFADGQLNVTVNCLDRHLNTPTADKVAIL